MVKINPFANSNPMSWKDAAIVSTVLALASVCIVWLAPRTLLGIQENLYEQCFDAIKFFLGVFFSNFLGLAGLTKYQSSKNKNGE